MAAAASVLLSLLAALPTCGALRRGGTSPTYPDHPEFLFLGDPSSPEQQFATGTRKGLASAAWGGRVLRADLEARIVEETRREASEAGDADDPTADELESVDVPAMTVEEMHDYAEELRRRAEALSAKARDICFPLDKISAGWRRSFGSSGERHDFIMTMSRAMQTFLRAAASEMVPARRAAACGDAAQAVGMMRNAQLGERSGRRPDDGNHSAPLHWLGRKVHWMVMPREAKALLGHLPKFDSLCFPISAIARVEVAREAKRIQAMRRMDAIDSDLGKASGSLVVGKDGHSGYCIKAMNGMWRMLHLIGVTPESAGAATGTRV